MTSVDELMPWIAAGIAVAAALQPWLAEPTGLSSLSPAAQVPVLATVAAPIYVCASGATPIAGVLFASGISAGAVVAFLIAGPATNVTTYGAVRTFFSRKSALILLGTVFVVTLGVGFLALAFPPGIPPLASDEHGTHGVLGIAGAVGCGLLFVPSLFRLGPRGYLEHLGLGVHDHSHHHHGHDHGHHHHGHDHGHHHHGHDHGHHHHHGHGHHHHGHEDHSHDHDHDPSHDHAKAPSDGTGCCKPATATASPEEPPACS